LWQFELHLLWAPPLFEMGRMHFSSDLIKNCKTLWLQNIYVEISKNIQLFVENIFKIVQKSIFDRSLVSKMVFPTAPKLTKYIGNMSIQKIEPSFSNSKMKLSDKTASRLPNFTLFEKKIWTQRIWSVFWFNSVTTLLKVFST
jgi:hypothetical protein